MFSAAPNPAVPARPRVLFITTYDPGAASLGGAAWVDQRLIQSLTRVAEVDVFAIVDRTAGHKAVPLEVRGSWSRSVRTLFRMLWNREPYQVAKFRWSKSWSGRLEELRSSATRADLVITSQWPALLAANEARLHVNTHVAHNVDYVLAETHDPRLFGVIRNASRTRKAEIQHLGSAQHVTALSLADAERIGAFHPSVNHVRMLDDSVEVVARKGRVVGFLGKMSWPPNALAFEVLRDQVLANVNRSLVGDRAQLVVAGRGSEALAKTGITALGEIADIDDFYDAIDVVVVPRIGATTGISVKMLEAVERGVSAIVPSQLARDASVSESVFIADTPAEMATLLVSYFEDRHPTHEQTTNERHEAQSVATVSLGNWANNIGQETA